jgi:hypothetical protein
VLIKVQAVAIEKAIHRRLGERKVPWDTACCRCNSAAPSFGDDDCGFVAKEGKRGCDKPLLSAMLSHIAYAHCHYTSPGQSDVVKSVM